MALQQRDWVVPVQAMGLGGLCCSSVSRDLTWELLLNAVGFRTSGAAVTHCC